MIETKYGRLEGLDRGDYVEYRGVYRRYSC